MTRLGVDVGGTKIEAIALAPDGAERARLRAPTPRGDYAATLAAIADLVARVAADADPADPVGVGIPGTLSPATGLVKNANTVWLNGQPLDRDLERVIGRPVRVANDANCFAVSEARDGAGAGARTVFGVILGTGVGGGVVVDGRVLTGVNAVAGEWGHNPLPWPRAEEWPGPPCYCGRTGCIETLLSGPALSRDYRALAGQTLEPPAIAARAQAGEPPAAAVLARYEERLARALASVINLLDPDVIVLGGGLSNLDRLYAAVSQLWSGWVFSDRVTTPLRRHRHGDASGVRGAAWLWAPPPAGA